MTQPKTSYSSSFVDRPQTIQASLNQVLAQEGRANELKLAYVRAAVLAISTTLDIIVFFFPQALIGQDSVSPTIALIGVTANVFALALVKALRQPLSSTQLRWLQDAIPLFDSLLLVVFITNIWHVFGRDNPLIITNITALCCLLAVTGGMRLTKWSSLITTILAIANFCYAAILFHLDLAIALFAVFTVFGTGFWGIWMASIVRRHVKNETGRVLMERFLPKTVVEAAFESPLTLLQQPSLCDVTIVVTDLRQFTHFAEKLEPQAVLDFLNQYQGLLARIVEHHGGWVDKFMGDGMLAVFGAPDGLVNHADQALNAAITMLHEVKTISPLPMGIGVHSGPVVAGCLGTTSHLEFTVIGDTVNVAARIEALTKDLGTPLLVSETTYRLLTPQGSGPLLQPLGEKCIRGRIDAITLFCLA